MMAMQVLKGGLDCEVRMYFVEFVEKRSKDKTESV